MAYNFSFTEDFSVLIFREIELQKIDFTSNFNPGVKAQLHNLIFAMKSLNLSF